MQCREKESVKSWFRSDRFFTIENRWYFITREGQNVGPFESINHARTGVNLFLNSVQKDNYSEQYAESIAQSGQWALTRFR
ncbi:MAG: DUF6316 family protein [Cellvibrionaceae bacterium]